MSGVIRASVRKKKLSTRTTDRVAVVLVLSSPDYLEGGDGPGEKEPVDFAGVEDITINKVPFNES